MVDSLIPEYYQRAKSYQSAKDPKCISFYEKCGDYPPARAQLSLIYAEGLGSVKPDPQKSLSYCVNNEEFLAQYIECKVRVFSLRETGHYPELFQKMTNLIIKYCEIQKY